MNRARTLLLNGEWDFVEAGDGQPPSGGWQRVRVPHRSREFEQDPPTSAWYRTSLIIPDGWGSDERERLVLHLDRVRHFGRAYLDGEPLLATDGAGEHFHLRLPWEVDLSGRVQCGREQELTIYTHACTGHYVHPDRDEFSEDAQQALDTRFWRTGAPTVGIEGDVWLRRQRRVRLIDPYIVTSVRENTLSVEVTVCNDSPVTFRGMVAWRVVRASEIELELPPRSVTVEPGVRTTVHVSQSWPDPAIWGRPPYGEPVLYFLRTNLNSECVRSAVANDCEDVCITRFGFREVWADGDNLLLNGEKLTPWGDHTVPYVYERQWLTRKFTDLAAANISIVEHHRYDPPSVFYDVADESGTFVVGANFCVGTGQVYPDDLDPSEAHIVMGNHVAVADAWIRRVRNHPSILFWDITDARDPSFCVPLLRKVRELDRTRIAEVTFDHAIATPELVELIDCYRLFSGLDHIQASIKEIRANTDLPTKPVRVGEAGIFESGTWDLDGMPPLMEGWWEFLTSAAEKNIHGLQTFFLTDMDYRGFTKNVPGSLSGSIQPDITWPSQSGTDARIDPFGEGTQEARGKAALYLNWCDPTRPLSIATKTRAWSCDVYRRLAGRDVGPLNPLRVPEVIVQVERDGHALSGLAVFAEPLGGQVVESFGVRADEGGRSWFVLPEPGLYRFRCGESHAEVATECRPVDAPPGYDHIQKVTIECGNHPRSQIS